MCYFLTVATATEHADHIQQAFARGYQLSLTQNPYVLAQLPDGFTARIVVSGMCSCSLYRPDAWDDSEPGPASTLARQPRIRKDKTRGWSRTKIQRALQQSESHRHESPKSPGLRSDVIERLQQICLSAGRVAVLVHFYNEDIETGKLALTRAPPCSLEEFSERCRTLKEDEVLIVKRHS